MCVRPLSSLELAGTWVIWWGGCSSWKQRRQREAAGSLSYSVGRAFKGGFFFASTRAAPSGRGGWAGGGGVRHKKICRKARRERRKSSLGGTGRCTLRYVDVRRGICSSVWAGGAAGPGDEGWTF